MPTKPSSMCMPTGSASGVRCEWDPLVVRRIRGTEVSSFEYDEAWLQRNDNRVLDPDLRLFGGPQYNSAGRPTFGVFVDSAPDRWGRSLMRRRETIRVRKDGGPPVDIASRHRVRRPPL